MDDGYYPAEGFPNSPQAKTPTARLGLSILYYVRSFLQESTTPMDLRLERNRSLMTPWSHSENWTCNTPYPNGYLNPLQYHLAIETWFNMITRQDTFVPWVTPLFLIQSLLIFCRPTVSWQLVVVVLSRLFSKTYLRMRRSSLKRQPWRSISLKKYDLRTKHIKKRVMVEKFRRHWNRFWRESINMVKRWMSSQMLVRRSCLHFGEESELYFM